ncbi:MAG: prephenate dehydratase [Thermoproteota archaeon]
MNRIRELRRRIDRVDEEIVRLIARRIELTREIGREKRRRGLPVVDEERERQVYRHVASQAKKTGIDQSVVERVFETIITYDKRLQGNITVSYLGPKGSFTMEAAMKHFSKEPCVFEAYPTIRSVFRSVEEGGADYGVVPVENSLEGSVSETLDSLASSSLKVVGEKIIRISMQLASKARSLEEVKTVFSHPHALAQARPLLERILPDARIREVSSTSAAAAMASKHPDSAAICSEAAAKEYGLRMLARDIQGEGEDYTRFLILGREMASRIRGNARTMIMMGLEHKPDALYRALGVFAALGINLTRIESRPVKERPWEYRFLIEFDGGVWDRRVSDALRRLRRRTVELKILGSYRPEKQ